MGPAEAQTTWSGLSAQAVCGSVSTWNVAWPIPKHSFNLAWNEAWSGTDQVRFCRVDDQTLTYTSPSAKSPFDGREIVHEVTYQRE
jgi:hypothetical protein